MVPFGKHTEGSNVVTKGGDCTKETDWLPSSEMRPSFFVYILLLWRHLVFLCSHQQSLSLSGCRWKERALFFCANGKLQKKRMTKIPQIYSNERQVIHFCLRKKIKKYCTIYKLQFAKLCNQSVYVFANRFRISWAYLNLSVCL